MKTIRNGVFETNSSSSHSIAVKKSWDNFFMGTDGQFTMYLDAVKKEFATSSTSSLRIPINGNIDYLFKQVREINNF